MQFLLPGLLLRLIGFHLGGQQEQSLLCDTDFHHRTSASSLTAHFSSQGSWGAAVCSLFLAMLCPCLSYLPAGMTRTSRLMIRSLNLLRSAPNQSAYFRPPPRNSRSFSSFASMAASSAIVAWWKSICL